MENEREKRNWNYEQLCERIKLWIDHKLYGNMLVNFKGGEVPNILETQSRKPPRTPKAGKE